MSACATSEPLCDSAHVARAALRNCCSHAPKRIPHSQNLMKVPQHVASKQKPWYRMAPPAPVKWYRQPVLRSLQNAANCCLCGQLQECPLAVPHDTRQLARPTSSRTWQSVTPHVAVPSSSPPPPFAPARRGFAALLFAVREHTTIPDSRVKRRRVPEHTLS